jgi:membrane protease YdiL (CAAX protease family)
VKRLLSVLLVSSLLSAQEEVALFDPIPTIQSTQQEIQLPAPPLARPQKSVGWAVLLSSLFPGLGHVYLDDMKMAGGLAGAGGAGLGFGLNPHASKSIRLSSLMTYQTICSYSLYSVYRDVRAYNGPSSYTYKMPADDLTDLTTAPFSWKVMKKPEVWGGVLSLLAIATGVSYLAFPGGTSKSAEDYPETKMSPLLSVPIGVGEEALFRGFLQASLAESFNPWGGIALSSIAFGAAHIPNAQALRPENRWRYYSFIVPLLTAFGSYAGWLTYKNHSLKESVALHTWYDMVLFAAGSFATEANITRERQYSFTWAF